MMATRRAWRAATLGIVLATAAAVAGCGPQGPPGTVWVTGTVLYEGKPLPAGAVHFLSKEKTPGAASGSVRLSSSRFGLYLLPGDYAVAVVSEEGVAEMDRKTGRMIPAKSRIPLKYTSVTDSGLRATIDAGHRTVAIDIRD